MNAPTAKEPEPKTSGPGRLEKVPTGIQGLDEITCGGLPRGRTTLVCGGPGCGKTLLALEFLVHGATQFGEPGVFIAFEETAEELATNGASLGFDLAALEADRKLAIDYVRIERSEIEESGEYDLEGLFIRIGFAIDSIGARRVAIDTLEVLFAGLPNPGILRAELRRLFRWLKDEGRHRDRHRRARRRWPDPPRTRGIHLRLRDHSRPPGQRPDLDPAAAGAEIPGLGPRHRRGPLPDR